MGAADGSYLYMAVAISEVARLNQLCLSMFGSMEMDGTHFHIAYSRFEDIVISGSHAEIIIYYKRRFP